MSKFENYIYIVYLAVYFNYNCVQLVYYIIKLTNKPIIMSYVYHYNLVTDNRSINSTRVKSLLTANQTPSRCYNNNRLDQIPTKTFWTQHPHPKTPLTVINNNIYIYIQLYISEIKLYSFFLNNYFFHILLIKEAALYYISK